MKKESVKLFAPAAFWRTPEKALKAIANGCGPGKVGDYLVSDRLFGLDIRPCCITMIGCISWARQ